MRIELTTRSPEETFELGRRIGARLEGRDVVLLEGDLGAGKTLLTKGLYVGVGGPDPDEVVSPSYTLINIYDEAPRPVHHVDLYRLEDPRHLLGLEYEDFLYLNPGLTVVEWPRSAPELLEPADYLMIRIAPGENDDERRLTIEAEGPKYAAVFAELDA